MLTNCLTSIIFKLIFIQRHNSPILKEKAINPGDEVITVAAGFPTTVAPIIQNGCVPVFVDVDIETHNVDVDALADTIRQAFSSDTRQRLAQNTQLNMERFAFETMVAETDTILKQYLR